MWRRFNAAKRCPFLFGALILLLGSDQYCAVQLRIIGSMTEPLNRFRVSQPPCNACERIEWIALGLRRKEKQEDDVYRPAVNRVKVDGVLETNQRAEWLLQIGYPSMRDSHAASCPRGSQVLALQQRNRNKVGVQIEGRGCSGGQFLQ